MNFTIDHDYHIHTYLSSCSRDPEQTAARLLQYAQGNGFTSLCVTDHFWDSTVPGASKWYEPQNLDHIRELLPLPTADGIDFMFGVETDMDKNFVIGISPTTVEQMDFIIVPTTHLHMKGFTLDEAIGGGDDEENVKRRAELYVKRFDALLNADLPFEKVGVAHLTCGLICREPAGSKSHLKVLGLVDDATFREFFDRSAQCGLGIELNFNPFAFEGEDLEAMLRPYRIAQSCGCKFYFGSDAHHPKDLDGAMKRFTRIAELLDLQEEQKFHIKKT